MHRSNLRAARRMLALVCGLALLFAVFNTQSKVASANVTASVRIVHASPDIGVADVFVDGNRLLSNFQFGTVTDYISLPSGQHKVQAALIGQGIQASVITQTIDAQPGTAYTVAALGTKALGFSLQVFQDDNLITGNNAKVRVYHLSPGTGEVTVTNSSQTVVSGLGYQQASKYLEVPAGAYTFNVVGPDNMKLPLSTTLKPWTVTSVFAVGLLNGTPKIQVVSAQTPGVPGMPGTGSDPNAPAVATASTSPFFATLPWLVGLLLLMLVGMWTMNKKAR